MNQDRPPPLTPGSQDAFWVGLRSLYRSIEPPSDLQARIMLACSTYRPPATAKPASPRSGWARWAFDWIVLRPWASLSLGLSLMLIVGVSGFLLGMLSGQGRMANPVGLAASVPEASLDLDSPYILIQAPAHGRLEPAQVIRIDLPRETMLDFGLLVPTDQRPGKVRTELLLGSGGELLAIRFLGSVNTKPPSSSAPSVVVAGITF